MYSSDGPDFEFRSSDAGKAEYSRSRLGAGVEKSGLEMAALERWLHEHEGKTIS